MVTSEGIVIVNNDSDSNDVGGGSIGENDGEIWWLVVTIAIP